MVDKKKKNGNSTDYRSFCHLPIELYVKLCPAVATTLDFQSTR